MDECGGVNEDRTVKMGGKRNECVCNTFPPLVEHTGLVMTNDPFSFFLLLVGGIWTVDHVYN